MDTPITLVSADGHVSAPPEMYADYIEKKYLPDLDALRAENEEWKTLIYSAKNTDPEILKVVDPQGAIQTDGEFGAWDIDRRVKELDREGVACEVILSGTQCSNLPFFGLMNRPFPPELRTAGLKAHHRWIAERTAAHPGRFHKIATSGPCVDLAETTAELRWCAQNGFVGVSMPATVADKDQPPLYDSHYEPFWATCAELDWVVLIHAGYGKPQGMWQDFLSSMQHKVGGAIDAGMREALENHENSPIFMDVGPRRALWQLMLSGAFDRYPNLRVAVTELRADWVPPTLAYLDRRARELRWPMKRLPSEYFAEHFAVTPSSPRPSEIALRHEIGVDRFLFGVDFPHPESTWPNTWEWIRDAFRGVPEAEARQILGQNAIRFYRLDKSNLDRIAQKIGPRVSDILGEQARVDERLIDHFHARARYREPAEVIDVPALDRAFSADVASVGAH